eukprot:TRINITY_DN152_c1_g2_i2.p1 TRINITY_DN152_c1_g2~~TRINITY_DN152_c1_g2_i2.p1  ORF type:complete len:526 (-),score=122.36 TRINITY_DN152_c1_g2_i2:41-1618(-)
MSEANKTPVPASDAASNATVAKPSIPSDDEDVAVGSKRPASSSASNERILKAKKSSKLSEQKRRDGINAAIRTLKAMVPACNEQRASSRDCAKQEVLSYTVDYIRRLQHERNHLLHINETMAIRQQQCVCHANQGNGPQYPHPGPQGQQQQQPMPMPQQQHPQANMVYNQGYQVHPHTGMPVKSLYSQIPQPVMNYGKQQQQQGMPQPSAGPMVQQPHQPHPQQQQQQQQQQADPSTMVMHQPASQNPSPVHDLCVLIVDDSPVELKRMARFLSVEGIASECANSGQAALDMMANRRFSLVLLDCNMTPMDGFQTLAHIRQRESRQACQPTTVIAITAHNGAHERQRCLSKGFDDFLPKPISRVSVLTTLMMYTSWRPREQGNSTPQMPQQKQQQQQQQQQQEAGQGHSADSRSRGRCHGSTGEDMVDEVGSYPGGRPRSTIPGARSIEEEEEGPKVFEDHSSDLNITTISEEDERFAIHRCVSRLNHMQSEDYMTQPWMAAERDARARILPRFDPAEHRAEEPE